MLTVRFGTNQCHYSKRRKLKYFQRTVTFTARGNYIIMGRHFGDSAQQYRFEQSDV